MVLKNAFWNNKPLSIPENTAIIIVQLNEKQFQKSICPGIQQIDVLSNKGKVFPRYEFCG